MQELPINMAGIPSHFSLESLLLRWKRQYSYGYIPTGRQMEKRQIASCGVFMVFLRFLSGTVWIHRIYSDEDRVVTGFTRMPIIIPYITYIGECRIRMN